MYVIFLIPESHFWVHLELIFQRYRDQLYTIFWKFFIPNFFIFYFELIPKRLILL